MKNKNIFKLLLAIAVVGFTACDDREEIIYDGNNTSNQALIGFSKESYNLEIEKDATGTLNIPIYSSALRNSDRTFNINIVVGDDTTTADPSTYNLPATVTIPANEYQGNLIIEGTDNGVETTPEILTIELEGVNATDASSLITSTINIYEVCPIPADFLVGSYTIADGTATVGPGNDSANFDTATVNISVGETPTSRVFSAVVLPGIGGANDITLSLVCGEFVLGNVNPGISCGDDIPYIYTKATDGGFVNSTYDLNQSDDSFLITYTEDLEGSCGGPFESTFQLTKNN